MNILNNKYQYLLLLILSAIKVNLIYCAAKITTEDNLDKNKFVSAAFYNKIEKVKKFLESGIDINSIYKSNVTDDMLKDKTALTATCGAINLQMVELLLSYGADVNKIDDQKDSPLIAVVSELVFRLQDPTIPEYVNSQNCRFALEIIKLLLDKKADINFRDSNGNTALIILTEANLTEYFADFPKLIKFLINFGADIDIANNEGMTALQWSINQDDIENLQLMLNAGAAIDIKKIESEIARINLQTPNYIDEEKIIKLLKNELIKRESFVKSLKQTTLKELFGTSAGISLIPPILDIISDYTIRYEDIPLQDKLAFSDTYLPESNNKDQKVNVVKLLLDSNKRKEFDPIEEAKEADESSKNDDKREVKKLKQ